MATYHVKHDAGGGGDGSFGNPWTLQEGADNAVAGDIVKIHNTGTYSTAVAVDFDTSSGSEAQMIQFVGVGAGETDSPELVEVQVTADVNGFDINNKSWLYFEGISIGHTVANSGWAWVAGGGADHLHFVNCKGHGSGNDGFKMGSVDSVEIVGCEAYDNDRHGIFLQAASTEARGILWGCVCHHNTQDGMRLVRYSGLVGRCACYANSDNGIYINAAIADIHLALVGNTCLANSDDGVHVQNTAGTEVFFANNVCVQNSAAGIDASTANTDAVMFGNVIPAGGADANGAATDFDELGNPDDILKPNLTGTELADFVDATLCYPDFRLDTNSDARGAAWPGTIPIMNLCTTTTTAAS
jgi:hypothetical protein